MAKSVTCLLVPAVICLHVLGCATTKEDDEIMLSLAKTYVHPGSKASLAPAYNERKLKKELDEILDDVKAREATVEDLKKVVIGEMLLRDYRNASKHAMALIRKEPRNEDYKRILGEIALRGGRLALAEYVLDGLKDQNNSETQNLKGLLAYLKNEPAAAADLFRKARAAGGKNLAATLNLGLLYLEFFKYDEAAGLFEEALRMDPTNANALLHKAIVLRLRKNGPKAGAILEDLAARYETSPLILHNLAVLRQEQGEYEEAYATVEKALAAARKLQLPVKESARLRDDLKKQVAKD